MTLSSTKVLTSWHGAKPDIMALMHVMSCIAAITHEACIIDPVC